eukprot:SAG31_NODE_2844_length_5009_cov_2.067006_3_plen_93_part_00
MNREQFGKQIRRRTVVTAYQQHLFEVGTDAFVGNRLKIFAPSELRVSLRHCDLGLMTRKRFVAQNLSTLTVMYARGVFLEQEVLLVLFATPV